MYERYTRQALPSRKYRELIGSAICVFNSNNSFIIENILRENQDKQYTWHILIDKTSGKLIKDIEKTISEKSDGTIAKLFSEIVEIRNRIVHSFQITATHVISNDPDNQMLASKYKDGKQVIITEEFLMNFINMNEKLADKLHDFRGF